MGLSTKISAINWNSFPEMPGAPTSQCILFSHPGIPEGLKMKRLGPSSLGRRPQLTKGPEASVQGGGDSRVGRAALA